MKNASRLLFCNDIPEEVCERWKVLPCEESITEHGIGMSFQGKKKWNTSGETLQPGIRYGKYMNTCK